MFIERCGEMAKSNCYQAMITQHAWMFLSSYESLRSKLLMKDTINMAHLGARAFDEIAGEVVQTTTFVMRRSNLADYKGTYCRLIEPTSEKTKEDMFLSGDNQYTSKQSNFSKIPGSPIVYWVSDNFIKAFENGISLGEIANPKQGMATADNNRFLREWYEVSNNSISLNSQNLKDAENKNRKWFPYNKGGEFRKWYGNNDYVVNWKNNGFEIRNFKNSVVRNPNYYFKECFSWSKISSGSIAFRYKPNGHIFDVAGTSVFSDEKDSYYMLGLSNSIVSLNIFNILSPTLNYEVGHVASLPVIINTLKCKQVEEAVKNNIELSKYDWDSYETSWDFKKSPLV